MLIISAPQCDIASSCVDSNVTNIHILTHSHMETVEAKSEVNVAKSVDTTFSQETGDRFVSPAPLLNVVWPSCDLLISDIQTSKEKPSLK